MKTNIFSYLTMMALAAGMSACSDDTWTPDLKEGGEGQLNTASIVPTVKNGEAIVITGTQGAKKAASRATIDLSNYIIDVTDANGAAVESWTFSTMPSLPTFTVGTYKVVVRSHNVQKAEWDKPYFFGEQNFQIRKDEVTDVEAVVCKLANIMVTVEFDSKLIDAAADGGADLKVAVTSEPGTTLEFTPAEKRAGYFQAIQGLETLKVSFTGTVSGNAESTTAVLTNVAAGQHRKIIMKLKSNGNQSPDETGNITVDGEGINVDFSVEEKNLAGDIVSPEENLGNDDRPNQEGEEPGGEDPNPPTPPGDEDAITLTSETLDVDGVNEAEKFGPGIKDAIVNIHSDAGVRNLNVEIISDFLTEEFLSGVGLTTRFDLANADDTKEMDNGETLATNLRGLGFPVNSDVTGKNDLVFDITGFMPLILQAGDHKFVITVTDAKGAQKGITLLIRKS